MNSLSKLAYVIEKINQGYEEINRIESPILFNDPNIVYLKFENNFTVVDNDGNFILWKDPNETQLVLKNWRPITGSCRWSHEGVKNVYYSIKNKE